MTIGANSPNSWSTPKNCKASLSRYSSLVEKAQLLPGFRDDEADGKYKLVRIEEREAVGIAASSLGILLGRGHQRGKAALITSATLNCFARNAGEGMVVLTAEFERATSNW